MKPFTENRTYTESEIYEIADELELEVDDTNIAPDHRILEVILFSSTRDEYGIPDEMCTLFEFNSSDDENYTLNADDWPDEHADKTPIFDEQCHCFAYGGQHRISLHGTPASWDANCFWVKPD